MSGKYEKSRKKPAQKKSAKKRKNKKLGLIMLVIVLFAVIAIAATLIATNRQDRPKETVPTVPTEAASTAATAPVKVGSLDEVSIDLNMQLEITDIGSYIGAFVEDGSDDFVSDVLMLVVKNITQETIQYAEIKMEIGEVTAQFTLSTLPAGESVVVLEQNRMAYSKDISYEECPMKVANVAISPEPLSLHEDKLKIQALDGIINVKNVSGADIAEDIYIYYKNSAADLYYGGITYRIPLKGGLKANEIKQVAAAHFKQGASTIMFASFGA